MTGLLPTCDRPRVVILAPTGKDAALTANLMREAAIEAVICEDIQEVAPALADNACVLLVAEEALAAGGLETISGILAAQPPWSDLPVLVLSRFGADSPTVAAAIERLGNVTLLERPVRPPTLVSAVRTALKARERQCQVGAYVAEQERINAELQQSIRQRERVEEALRDADRRKDEFLATLAHELRNPLAPISNSLQVLRMGGHHDPLSEEVFAMMERQVGHLVRLVDDLMEVSRITRGKVELRLARVEIADVIRSAVEESRPLIDAAGHQLSLALPEEPLLVVADPVRLSQVFTNLLNNSAKYMLEGGRIWLTAARRGEQVAVTVRDEGIGIPAEMLPHIFKMFTQVDRSNRQAQGGLGIGLTLVRTLVEMHGGVVAARSAGPGQGSEFEVCLPLQMADADDPTVAAIAVPAGLTHRRVLIVDDNRDAAESLQWLLKLQGLEACVVYDGPSALRTLPAYQPDVVLLDIGMPGMDGYEVAQRIRQLPDGQHPVLVALTGWGQAEDRRRSAQAGFDHHLLKPPDMAELRLLLKALPVGDGVA